MTLEQRTRTVQRGRAPLGHPGQVSGSPGPEAVCQHGRRSEAKWHLGSQEFKVKEFEPETKSRHGRREANTAGRDGQGHARGCFTWGSHLLLTAVAPSALNSLRGHSRAGWSPGTRLLSLYPLAAQSVCPRWHCWTWSSGFAPSPPGPALRVPATCFQRVVAAERCSA